MRKVTLATQRYPGCPPTANSVRGSGAKGSGGILVGMKTAQGECWHEGAQVRAPRTVVENVECYSHVGTVWLSLRVQHM